MADVKKGPINIFEEILKAQREGKSFALVTVIKAEGSVPRHDAAKMLVFDDGSAIGTVGGGLVEARAIEEARSAIREGRSRLAAYTLNQSKAGGLPMLCGGDVELFIEVFKARPHVIIAGGGHVGKALADMVVMTGCKVTVIDDRPEWANRQRFPEVDDILVEEDMAGALSGCEIDRGTSIVIVTRGHRQDKMMLEAALKTDAGYIGMIGSRKKVADVFAQLRSEGMEEAVLRKVYAPIGLDLGAETPEEIALSILAEIMMVRNGTTGVSLSKKGGAGS